MYVKAIDQKIVKFPYTRNDLKTDYPNVAFPKNPSEELLAEWNVYAVVAEDAPEFQKGQVVEQAPEPVYVNGQWVLKYTVRDMTEEELNHQGDLVRSDRNNKLTESDWTQLADSPLGETEKLAWANYRQSLRDITKNPAFPFITLPEAP